MTERQQSQSERKQSVSERRPSNAGPADRRASVSYHVPPAGFPTHNSPRVWFITSALSPIGIRLIRLLLAHGDYVAAGLPPKELEDEERSAEYRDLINEVKSSRKDREGWKDRIRGIKCDGRVMGNAQAAVAEAVELWGRIDILLCNASHAVVGTVEELCASPQTESLIRDQFNHLYFAPLNFIKATLPLLRAKHNGHLMILTGVTGHIGTPGMPMYCAATWALEGFCDCLAYEIAPFNIKMTIVQPNKEIQLLTNNIVFAPPLPQYDSSNNPAPMLRDILSDVVNLEPSMRSSNQASAENRNKTPSNRSAASPNSSSYEEHEGPKVLERYPRLRPEAKDQLVLETVHAITAIGGHENPPARHIVGFEGIASVKEKLKTVSEELEDFVEVSLAVDILKTDVGPPVNTSGMEFGEERNGSMSGSGAGVGMGQGDGLSGAQMGMNIPAGFDGF